MDEQGARSLTIAGLERAQRAEVAVGPQAARCSTQPSGVALNNAA